MNVLFICEDYSLALMAQAILATLGGGRFRAYGAGYAPCATHGAVIDFLARHRMSVDGLRPERLDGFRAASAPRMDFVITLAEVDENFSDWPGAPFIAHWNVLDEADDITREPTQRDAFWTLMRRIKIFASLPQGSLNRRVLERRALTLQASYL